MFRSFLIGLLCATVLMGFQHAWAGGSSSWSTTSSPSVRSFHGMAYSLADGLEQNLVQRVDRTRTILFTSFVELDNLNVSSTFGRLMGEQVASRMSQHGYRIIEHKLRQGSMVLSQETGAIVLSRDLRDVRTHHDVQAVLVGTYVVTANAVVMSLKLLSTRDGSILASHDASLPKTQEINELITRNTTAFQPSRAPSEERGDSEGPLARGAVLLDPKNSLAARLIQTRLAELNYYSDRIDGIWGKNSRTALNRFKSSRQLASPTTWDLSTQRELFTGSGQ